MGFVTSQKQKEVILTCYSGAVKSICERKAAKKLGLATEAEAAGDEEAEQTVKPKAEEKKQK